MKNKLFLLFTMISLLAQAEEVSLKTDSGVLKGTLDIPNGEGKHPVVILIAGSGPTDRNGNSPGMTNNSLKLVSDALVMNGYACLRYDKRGAGESASAAPENEKDMKFDQFYLDAAGWSALLKRDSRFSKVIGIGHSQGSLVGMLAGNKRGAFDGFISLCGPSNPIQVTLKDQLSNQLTGDTLKKTISKLDSLADGYKIYEIPPGLESIFLLSVQPFLISWMKYNPTVEISRMNIPNMVIGGTTDLQVPADDAKVLASANERSELVIIKNMNHVLRYTKEEKILSQMEVYSNPDLPLHEKLMKSVLKFLIQFKSSE